MAANNINLTFSGAGFLAMYQIGVASCFKYYGRKLLDNVSCYGGCSAGAMCAAGLLCDIDLEQSVLLLMDTAAKIRDGTFGPFSSSFDPVNTIKKVFMAVLPAHAYKMATGRLFISLTRVSDWKNVIVSEFDSNKDLIDALTCTSFIPFYCGVQPPKFRGVTYIDGGFSDNLLQHFDGTNITVSVFSGDSDICPSDGHRDNSLFDMNNVTVQFSGHNIYRLIKALFPLDTSSLTDLCRQGFQDTLNYLQSKYPDMLSIDADIVSIPYCCGGNLTGDDENAVLSCSCGSEEGDYKFSEAEKAICKEKALKSLIIPEPIFQILSKAETIVGERDVIYQAYSTMLAIVKWLAQPSCYITKHVYYFINDLFRMMLPKVENYYNNNFIMRNMLSMAKKAFYAYHDSGNFEWHPSLGESQKADIIKTRERLKSGERSFVAIRKISSEEWRPKSVSVSSDGSDLPSSVRPKGWSILSDDVFESDEVPKKETKFSSPSFGLLVKASQTIIECTTGDNDYGNDLNYDDNDEDGYYSDYMNEDDHVSPIYF